LRLGAFATPEEAKAFAQELAARGLQPVVASLPARGDVVLHTVCAGRYGNRSEAVAAASDLGQRQGLAAAVVAEGAPSRPTLPAQPVQPLPPARSTQPEAP
jgi:hypothetical protein